MIRQYISLFLYGSAVLGTVGGLYYSNLEYTIVGLLFLVIAKQEER